MVRRVSSRRGLNLASHAATASRAEDRDCDRKGRRGHVPPAPPPPPVPQIETAPKARRVPSAPPPRAATRIDNPPVKVSRASWPQGPPFRRCRPSVGDRGSTGVRLRRFQAYASRSPTPKVMLPTGREHPGNPQVAAAREEGTLPLAADLGALHRASERKGEGSAAIPARSRRRWAAFPAREANDPATARAPSWPRRPPRSPHRHR